MDVNADARKSHARWWMRLAGVVLIVALAAVAAAAVGRGAQAPAVTSHAGLETVPLNPDAAAALKAQGKTPRSQFALKVNRGKKFNPVGGLVPTLQTGSEQDVLVLFVRFSDAAPGSTAAPLDLSYYDDLLFGTVYDPPEYKTWAAANPGKAYPTDRTLVNFYKEASYGAVHITTLNMPSAMGWSNTGNPYTYYCKADGVHDNGFGPYPQNAQGLVVDAVKLADSKVDFSKYAVNGVIPNLFVVFAGTGAEWSGAPDIIWSHSWDLTEGTGMDGLMVDGVKVNNYAMMPEVGGDLTGFTGVVSGPYPPTVGVFAHEYGHVLGLPDEYDYGYESEGTGNYSLMAGGSWNRWPFDLIFDGNSPAQLDAWAKVQLGFDSPTVVSSTTTATLKPSETDKRQILKMVVPGSGGKEYFLFENRQNVGFDQGLQYRYRDASGARLGIPLHGLAVYHVDDNVFTMDYWRPNEAQNWKEFRSEGAKKADNGATHYALSLLQADDRWDLEHGVNGGDPGDLYPGAGNVTSLGSTTQPNTSSYYFWQGTAPKFGFSGITASGIAENNGQVSLTLSFAPSK
jgi:immune inhibitor A